MREGKLEYFIPEAEINVTEDYMRDLALRTQNEAEVDKRYQKFLESKQVENKDNIVPFSTQEAEVAVSQAEQPEIPAVSIAPEVTPQQNTDAPKLATEAPTVVAGPVIEEVKPEIPSVDVAPEIPQMNNDTNNIVEFPGTVNTNTIIEEQPVNMMDTPIINETPIVEDNTKIVDFPSMNANVSVENNAKEENQSVVEASYLNTANELIAQMRELTNKYLQTMEDMIVKMQGNLKETNELKELYIGAVDKAQQMLVSQNQSEEVTTTRAA